ncbi:hypothetical protein CQY20_09680 [Mycolicibacterium agri]|uniref:Secreted protein n=1 Tax=Mycolicibacterium agri TaxID=36811 RepID=A0A2A7N7J8_MYCAG|nr:hypothetical protein [Mycolicibacterium agri]PEG39820.1 hypothetical protein CQY20_09680 [Mycolicibacterium agri]GFG52475.1 hypothetical protein MAGR_39160 [Mycolicibacterium agri]
MGAAALAAGAAVVVPGVAAAEPTEPPPPPPPNVNAFEPVKPSEFAVYDGAAYAFTTPDGLTCMLQRSGGYGCSGVIPGAPEGANLVSGAIGGVPGFSNVVANPFANAGDIKPLPPNARLSYQTLSCGTDGSTTSCVDSRNQSGFVISPAGSFILNAVNPLVDRPEGTNPYFN